MQRYLSRALGTALLVLPSVARAASAPIVVDNHPPEWSEEDDDEHTTKPKSRMEVNVRATDADRDPITYKLSGLPVGARAEASEGGVIIRWTPKEEDIGTYDVIAEASDGKTSVERTIRLVVEEQVESFFMPGVGYELWLPNGSEKLGAYNGFRIEFIGASYIHRNPKPGPSHGRFYIHFDVLFSGKSGGAAAFLPTAGFDFSLEKNPPRRFLIPFFGLEGGALFNSETGTLGFMMPFVGVHFWSSGNVQLGVHGGYFLPFTSEQFDTVRGVRGSLTADFSFW